MSETYTMTQWQEFCQNWLERRGDTGSYNQIQSLKNNEKPGPKQAFEAQVLAGLAGLEQGQKTLRAALAQVIVTGETGAIGVAIGQLRSGLTKLEDALMHELLSSESEGLPRLREGGQLVLETLQVLEASAEDITHCRNLARFCEELCPLGQGITACREGSRNLVLEEEV